MGTENCAGWEGWRVVEAGEFASNDGDQGMVIIRRTDKGKPVDLGNEGMSVGPRNEGMSVGPGNEGMSVGPGNEGVSSDPGDERVEPNHAC